MGFVTHSTGVAWTEYRGGRHHLRCYVWPGLVPVLPPAPTSPHLLTHTHTTHDFVKGALRLKGPEDDLSYVHT